MFICGGALTELRKMPESSVHCCVTSPPYWGLRDYGVVGQLGLEKTPEEYVARMVEVFAEVRRVLRDDGTLWVNIGDSYNSGTTADRQTQQSAVADGKHGYWTNPNINKRCHAPALKPKDMVGIPWMLAFALRADGWYLRSEIIWHKPNPMPESVTDRPTKAHEQVFLLAKSEQYYYDIDAIRERASDDTHARYRRAQSQYAPPAQEHHRGLLAERKNGQRVPAGWHQGTRPATPGDERGVNPKAAANTPGSKQNASFSSSIIDMVEARNKRSVWTINTQGYSEAHFATFPEDLVRPCILAGCPVGGTVLDPFAGAGTTGLVAKQNGCEFIGIELNPEYVVMAEKRLAQEVLAFT